MATRMESTGEKGQVQLSQVTADLLVAAGKGHWTRPREDKVVAKGKGEMQTHWLTVKANCQGSQAGSESNFASSLGLSSVSDDTEEMTLSPNSSGLLTGPPMS